MVVEESPDREKKKKEDLKGLLGTPAANVNVVTGCDLNTDPIFSSKTDLHKNTL